MVRNISKTEKPYEVRVARPPYYGKWEHIVEFDTFRKAVKFAKKCERHGYEAIDIVCRNYSKGYKNN